MFNRLTALLPIAKLGKFFAPSRFLHNEHRKLRLLVRLLLSSCLLLFLVVVINFRRNDMIHGVFLLCLSAWITLLAYSLQSLQQQQKNQLRADKAALEAALAQAKSLDAFLSICAACKKIRDNGGDWQVVERYFDQHMAVKFSHTICPECRQDLYPIHHASRQEHPASTD